MIPKILFQTNNNFYPAKYMIECIQSRCVGWEYKFFDNNQSIQFILENPIKEFENSIAVFNNIKSEQYKATFFRYYYLYVNGGVYLDFGASIHQDLDNIICNRDFFCVESALNNKTFFNGFIASVPKHKIIYECLKHLYNITNEEIDKDPFISCRFLYNIYYSTKQILDHDTILDNSIILNEIIPEGKDYSEIYDGDNKEIIVKHHFTKKIPIYENYQFAPKIKKSLENTKIGITLSLPDNLKSFYSNGIRQNALYLNELLLNIGYNSVLIIDDKSFENFNKEHLDIVMYNGKFKYIKFSQILEADFDFVITLGYRLDLYQKQFLNYTKVKVIGYLCGNNYIIESEKILYSQNKEIGILYPKTSEESAYDEIWTIPQMVNTNLHYNAIMQRVKCREVPFVWSNKSVEFSRYLSNSDLHYISREQKSVAIFEPNISIMKWCLPPLIICEQAVRAGVNIKHVYITNTPKPTSNINTFNIVAFNEFVKSMDLKQKGLVSIENRYNTLDFMTKYADIVVSHQWENPLNYLYLDLAWMGWPVLHNAHLCSDVGYYYEGFDYTSASKMLNYIIENHDNNRDEYLAKNRQNIDRFLPTNKELQKTYIDLIDSLYDDNQQ